MDNEKDNKIKRDIGLPEDTPMLDASDEDFKEQFDFAMWSTGSSSDYRNDRERPYNGQAHTDQGERGRTEINGLTMRDIADCIVQGFLSCSEDRSLSKKVKEIHPEFKGTKYADQNTWRYQDLYKIDLNEVDPMAVIQNAMCHIEDMMNIYPNVDNIKERS